MKIQVLEEAHEVTTEEVIRTAKIEVELQLIKETDHIGGVWYCLHQQGRYIGCTYTSDYHKAVEMFAKYARG